jgi:hypothetical protein
MKDKPLNEEAIGVLIDRKINESLIWYNAKLSREREKTMQYFNGELPLRQSSGSSSYISTEVYDAVESMKAQLLETFSAGREIAKFDPNSPEDSEEARIATAYCDYVLFKQNDGYKIFNEVIHDGLMARVGVAKVYWEEDEKYIDEEFDDLTEDEVMALAAEEDITDLQADADEDQPSLYSGKLTRKIDASQVRIEVINPEEFCIEPQSKHLGPEYFCDHRSLKTKDELIKMGFDKKKVDSISRVEDKLTLQALPETWARFQQLDAGFKIDTSEQQDELKAILVHECYWKFKKQGDKHAKLHKIVRAGNVTLEIQEVDDLPFVVFTPLPISHSFYGNNFAARVIPSQNVRTVLTRAIVDHATITVNPRYTVLKGGLTNPRELLDNRLGGLVNVTRPDAISPLEQSPLNPFVYQTLELIKSQTEETTGISSLSQGLNKDAISSQNSDAMVERLVSLSQTRQKIIARNFANNFLIPLYLKIYNLVVTKEDKEKVVELTGNWVKVKPSSWRDRKSISVSLHLGYREHDTEAQKRLEMAAFITQNPAFAPMFQMNNAYKLASDVMKLRGMPAVNDYLTPPNQVPPPQPDPMAVKQLENETMKAQAALITAQSTQGKVKANAQIDQAKVGLEQNKAAVDAMVKQRDADRKDLDIHNKVDVAQREMALEETMRPEEIKQTNIVSPNG